VAQINIPPLRQRTEDILPLFQHFAEVASQRYKVSEMSLDTATRALLLSHEWPGNIRELQNAAERWVLGLDLAINPASETNNSDLSNQPLAQQVEAFERSLIVAELAKQHSSLREVAEALQLPRKTLHDKLRKHGLSSIQAGENPPNKS